MEVSNAINKVKRFGGYTGKMIVVGVLVIICFIGSLLVLGVVSERENREAEVAREVGEAWGRPQLVAGPVVAVPFTRYERMGSAMGNARYILYILPKDLSIANDIKPELRSRGIFSAPVYQDDINLVGSFATPNLKELSITPSSLLWSEATLLLGLSDTRNINVKNALWNNGSLTFNPGAALWNVNGMGIHGAIPWNQTLA